MAALRRDPDATPRRADRPRVHKGFTDKLSPAYRWLAKRCDRPWAEVEGEIFATFDVTTLAGRHLVFDHLLRDIDRGCFGGWRSFRFHVDDDGVLRDRGRRRYRRRHDPDCDGCYRCGSGETKRAHAFAAGRRVGVRGERLYWLHPVRPDDALQQFYRQGQELNAAERLLWESLSRRERKVLREALDPPS